MPPAAAGVLAALALALPAAAAAAGAPMTLRSEAIALTLDPVTFAFTVSVDGEPWFNR